MTTRESEVNPFLQGNFSPIQSEDDVESLQVIGEIPRDLAGTYFRNGPNPAFEPPGRYHWFDGDGMIHGIRIRDGKASYRNRWVRNRGIEEEFAAGRATFRGLLEMDPGEGGVGNCRIRRSAAC